MWQSRSNSQAWLSKIIPECKPLCDHFCLNSFYLTISFMNMERVSSILVFIRGLFLTQNASSWCPEILSKGVKSFKRRDTLPCGENHTTPVCSKRTLILQGVIGRLPCCEEIFTQIQFTLFGKQHIFSLMIAGIIQTIQGFMSYSLSLSNFKDVKETCK